LFHGLQTIPQPARGIIARRADAQYANTIDIRLRFGTGIKPADQSDLMPIGQAAVDFQRPHRTTAAQPGVGDIIVS